MRRLSPERGLPVESSVVSEPPGKPLIVVPAWNEEASVGAVVREIRRTHPRIACLVVDDGSSDRTSDMAAAAGAIVLRLPFNLGVGGAMRTGFRFAVDRGYDVVVQVDADGQHDPRYIGELLERLATADIVIGARFAGVGQYGARGPRRWAMRILAGVVGAVTRRRLSDVTSGFKAMGPRAVRLFAETYPAEWLGDTVEALVIAARSGLVISQSPVAMRARQAGEPSQGPVRATLYLLRAGIAVLMAVLRPPVASWKEEVR